MKLDRHRRLKIALIIQGKTFKEFAKELGVHPGNLWTVSIERGISERVTKAIDEVIESSEIIFSNYLAEKKLNTNPS